MITHPKEGEVVIMDWFGQYSHKKYEGKVLSLAFFREKEPLIEEKLDDEQRALLEILTQRLNVK